MANRLVIITLIAIATLSSACSKKSDSGSSNGSSNVGNAVPTPAINPPTSLTAVVNNTNTGFDLQWQRPANAGNQTVNYVVYRNGSPLTNTSSLTHADTAGSLLVGVLYTYTVRAQIMGTPQISGHSAGVTVQLNGSVNSSQNCTPMATSLVPRYGVYLAPGSSTAPTVVNSQQQPNVCFGVGFTDNGSGASLGTFETSINGAALVPFGPDLSPNDLLGAGEVNSITQGNSETTVVNGQPVTYLFVKVDTTALTKNVTYAIKVTYCDHAGNCGSTTRNFIFQ